MDLRQDTQQGPVWAQLAAAGACLILVALVGVFALRPAEQDPQRADPAGLDRPAVETRVADAVTDRPKPAARRPEAPEPATESAAGEPEAAVREPEKSPEPEPEAVAEAVPDPVPEAKPEPQVAAVDPKTEAGDPVPVPRRKPAAIAELKLASVEPVERRNHAALAPETRIAALPGEPEEGPLPAVLSEADVERYKKIFAAQKKARWKTADKLIAELEDRRLLGYVLAERYLHPTAYRSSYKQLRNWLAKYGDLPNAKKVYGLALKKRKAGSFLPPEPEAKAETLARLGPITYPPYRSKKKLSRSQRRRVRQLQRAIRVKLARVQLSSAEKLLRTKEVRRLFDEVQIDEAQAGVAAGWFYLGEFEKAIKLAIGPAQRSGEWVPLAHWTTGLAAWRLGDFATSALHFEALSLSNDVSGWNSSAGAYWAARAHQKLGNEHKLEEWLARAAEHPRTFYGLIAHHRLGRSAGFDFTSRPLDADSAAPLLATPAGGRALALLQLGDTRRVEKEIMALEGWERPAMVGAILAVAERARLPALSLRVVRRLVAGGYEGWTREALDGAFYPVPPWEPKSGFLIDRAVVYGFMRQESAFKQYAKSPDGARGLMQLMPATATSVAKGRKFKGRARYALYDPPLNLDLGQRYLRQLLRNRHVQRDLFSLAAAYNAGPGNLRSWKRRLDVDDPLLFIESLPARETRLFIERVLANLWVYRARLGQPAPSLAAVAADRWPLYEALDGRVYPETEVALRGNVEPEAKPWWKFGKD